MRGKAVAIALIILHGSAWAAVEKTSSARIETTPDEAAADPRMVEAQTAFEEGRRLKEAGQYVEAVSPLERALDLWEAVFAGPHPKVADCLILLGELHLVQAAYSRAEPLLVRALESRKASVGESHPGVASALNNLATLYKTQGLYARAEPLYARALELQEVALGKNHPGVASSLNGLANLYKAQGLYARAEPLYARALKIQETTLDENHPDVAVSLSGLANLYQAQGLYTRAEPLYTRTLKIKEIAYGEHHPAVATALNNLAIFYKAQGLHARAEPLYMRALKIREDSLGENHPDLATSLNSLALLYCAQGNYARAEPLLVRALRIREAALGDNHPDVANSLNNLASLYHFRGLYPRATPLYERALKIREITLGESHPEVATSLNNLAGLYHSQGLYGRAEPLYARAIRIWEASLGEKHPQIAIFLSNLASLHLAQRQGLDRALELFERAFVISEEHLRQEVFDLSEQRLSSFLSLLRDREHIHYALARAYPNDARVLRLALTVALLRKGRSVQEFANTSRIIYRNLDDEDRKNFTHLRTLRTQLATLSLTQRGTISPAGYQQRLKSLRSEGDALEASLARRSKPLRRFQDLPLPAQLISRVTEALPSDGALIEIVAYRDRPLVPRKGTSPAQAASQQRYLAILLFADGHIAATDLGPAKPIDSHALRFHGALARRASSYLPSAQALYNVAFHPLLPYVGKTQRLFLIPDGQLNLVPFAALHDGRDFLVDVFDITYLTSGKDLVARSEDNASVGSVVVLADPDFSTPRTKRADLPWTPLPGTRAEAEAIHRLFPHAQLLLGTDANKQALLRLSAPGVLHIATHGFFLEDDSPSPDSREVKHFGPVGLGREELPDDPLLRSGLILAAARSSEAPLGSYSPEEAVVTALELAGLNLWGTQLVVLSACDTGRGDIRIGEGVYGLRRAFLIAGAKTLVTSLWKVNDATTSQLMEVYYGHLLASRGRAAALREAMRDLRHKQPHPHFWAPFITIGQDGPLRNLAPATMARKEP